MFARIVPLASLKCRMPFLPGVTSSVWQQTSPLRQLIQFGPTIYRRKGIEIKFLRLYRRLLYIISSHQPSPDGENQMKGEKIHAHDLHISSWRGYSCFFCDKFFDLEHLTPRGLLLA